MRQDFKIRKNTGLVIYLEWAYQDCIGQLIEIKVSFLIFQGFSWTEIYFGHFVQAAPILFGHLENF